MLPGSFVERNRACGRPNCHCANGKKRHVQYQISVLVDGQPKAFNVPAKLVEQVRKQVEMRDRFDAAVFLGAAMQMPSLLHIEAECCHGAWAKRMGRIRDDTIG